MRAALLPPAILLVAAAPMVDPPIQPGYWEGTSAVTNLQVPGLPGFLARMMTKTKTEKRCITPDQAAHGPIEALSKRPGCTVQSYRMDHGTFDFATLCPEKDGARSTIHIQGRYTATGFDATGSIQGIGGKKGDLRIDFTDTGRRLGDCPAVQP